jgi:hypothetical protein
MTNMLQRPPIMAEDAATISPNDAIRLPQATLARPAAARSGSHIDGAAVLLGEISAGRIDPEQAWFWTREWQEKEREADDDLAAGRVTSYDTDAEFLAGLDERTKPLDADA